MKKKEKYEKKVRPIYIYFFFLQFPLESRTTVSHVTDRTLMGKGIREVA